MKTSKYVFCLIISLLYLNFIGCAFEVKISPKSPKVDRGDTVQFTAKVDGGEGTSQSVTWELEGGNQGTSLTRNGLLRVSANEMATSLNVKATSVQYSSRKGYARVIINNPLRVTHVIVEPKTINMTPGGTYQFTASVQGFNEHSQNVTWSVSSGNPQTNISSTGLLTVSSGDASTIIFVRATSMDDQTIRGQAVVTLNNGVINRDVNDVETWVEVMRLIRDGGNNRYYNINLNGDISLPVPTGNNFGSVTNIVVSIQGTGSFSLSANGALIELGNGQTLIVKNISMYGRNTNNSSLVILNSGSKFIMEDNARITGNHTSGSAGGVLIRAGAEFILDSSSIVNNSSSGTAGGVYVDGVFLMRGDAYITGNNISGWNSCGGVYVASEGKFTMENGSISGNNSQRSVGGVRVSNKGLFVMLNGSISSNIANEGHGGGVFVSGSSSEWGSFILQNGIISGNTARSGSGGGIYFESNAYFVKFGGTITGSDTPAPLGNNSTNQGAAVFRAGNPNKWRNRTAGPSDLYDEFFYEN